MNENVARVFPRFLLSCATLLRVAKSEYAHGGLEEALAAVDGALRKLEKRSLITGALSPEMRYQLGDAWLLKGHILARLPNARPFHAFLTAHGFGRHDAGSLSFLAAELLTSKDLRPQAKLIYLDYLSQTHNTDGPARLGNNLELLQAISTPDFSSAETAERARVWNEQIISICGGLLWAHDHIGRIALAQNKWRRAIQAFDTACNLEPDNYAPRHMLAYALAQDGRLEDARKELDLLVRAGLRRNTLLLRAEVLRRLGDPAGAALDYQRADQIGSINTEQRLAFAEALVNAGRVSEAGNQLNLFSEQSDPRWLLLRALADEAEGGTDQALSKLCSIVCAPTLARQVARHIVRIAAGHPEAACALQSLRAVAKQYRDDAYWMVRGNALLRAGQTEGALKAWNRVTYPTPELLNAIGAAARYFSASLYNKEGDERIIALSRVLPKSAISEELVEIITSALLRSLMEKLKSGRQSVAQSLKALHEFESWLPSQNVLPQITVMRGLLYSAGGEHQRAFRVLSSLPSGDIGRGEVMLQLAKCAMHLGKVGACAKAIEALSFEDSRTARLRCAWATSAAKWDLAVQYLRDAELAESELGIRAAILVQAGMSAELEKIRIDGGGTQYYQALDELRRGNRTRAAEKLSSVAETDPMRGAATRLLGWIRLQDVKNYSATGETQQALKSLADAVDLWPEDDGPVSCFPDSEDGLILVRLVAGDRQRLSTVLQAQAAEAGLAEPVTGHNLGLFHLAEGSRCAQADDFENAIANWEQSIAYIGVALSDVAYMENWVRRRCAEYGIQLATDALMRDLQGKVIHRYEAEFTHWTECLKKRDREREADRVSDLGLYLRAELRGGELVRKAGGFKAADHRNGTICAGPAYVSLMGCQKAFAEFLAALKVKHYTIPDISEEADLFTLFKLLEEFEQEDSDDAVEPGVKEELQKLFSALRFAAALEREGRPEEALRRVRQLQPQCAMLSQKQTCDGTFREACQPSRPNFTRCNPAFAGEDGAEGFRNIATEYEVALLTEVGKNEVASTSDRLWRGVQFWREAASLAERVKQRESVTREIREAALGRAKVLREKDREEEAIRLLEGIGDFCGDSELRGTLSSLYAGRGVEAGNAQRWDSSVKDLRRARELNPHSSYANSNLLTALRAWASETAESGPNQAIALLREAVNVGNECLRADPHNSQLRQVVAETRAELAMLNLKAGEKARVEDLLVAALGRTAEGVEQLSTIYHNRGLEKAKGGDLKGAVEDLERAFELEPTSDLTKGMLGEAVAALGVSLARENKLDEALQEIERGLLLDPANEALMQHQKAISLLLSLRGRR